MRRSRRWVVNVVVVVAAVVIAWSIGTLQQGAKNNTLRAYMSNTAQSVAATARSAAATAQLLKTEVAENATTMAGLEDTVVILREAMSATDEAAPPPAPDIATAPAATPSIVDATASPDAATPITVSSYPDNDCTDTISSIKSPSLFRLSACYGGLDALLSDFGTGYDDVIVRTYDRVVVYPGSASGFDKAPSREIAFYSTNGDPYKPISMAVLTHIADSNDPTTGDYGGLIVGWQDPSLITNTVALYLADKDGLHDKPDWTINGPAIDGFGNALAAVGDMDCDGYTDIAVGSPLYEVPTKDGATPRLGSQDIWMGAVFIYSGQAIRTVMNKRGLMPLNALTTANAVVYGQFDGERFGAAVAGAGKVQGPEECDAVAVGAPDHNSSSSLYASGRVVIYYGDRTLFSSTSIPNDLTSSKNKWQVEGTKPLERFGSSVSGIGDVRQKTGYAGVVIGAPGYSDEAGRQVGAAFVYYDVHSDYKTMHSDHQANRTLVQPDLENTGSDQEFGDFVWGGMDLDGCGYADIVVGSVTHFGAPKHAIYVYQGGSEGVNTTPMWYLIWPNDTPTGPDPFVAIDIDAKGAELAVGNSPSASALERVQIYTHYPPRTCQR